MEDKKTNNLKSLPAEALDYLPRLNEIPMPVGILSFYLNENYELIFINEFLAIELGYESYSDLVHNAGCSLFSSIHPEDLAAFKEYMASLQNLQDSHSLKCRIRCKDNGFLWFEIVGIHHEKENKNIVAGVCVNISKYTDLQRLVDRTKADIRNVELELKTALENFPGGFHTFRLFDEYTLDYISDGFCQMCGYTPTEIAKKYKNHYLMLIHEDDREMFRNALQELAEYPHQKKLEYRIQNKEGAFFWVLDTINSFRDTDGKMRAYSSVVNIDKWYRHWKSLEKMTGSVPCGITMCEYHADDGSFRLLYFNDALCELVGCSRGELENISIENLKNVVVEDDLKKLYENLQTMISTGKQVNCEFRLKEKPEDFWIYKTAKIIESNKNVFLITAAFFDISEMKKTEKELSLQNYCIDRLNESLLFGLIVIELGMDKKPLYASRNIQNLLTNFFRDSEQEENVSYECIIHPADYQQLTELVRRYQKEQPLSFELEFRLRKEDGTFFWVKEIAKRLDDFISPNTYLIVFTDVNNIKNAEMQLRIREEEYRIAVMHSKNIILRYNIQERVVYVSSEVAKAYRIPSVIENMPGFLVESEIVQPESVSDYMNFYEGIAKGENRSVEIKAKDARNISRWFLGVSTVVFDEKQMPVSAIISFSDITEHKQKSSEIELLKESEQLLQIIVESSPKILLKYDFNADSFCSISPVAKAFFGTLPELKNSKCLINSPYIAEESLNEARDVFEKMKSGVPKGSMNIRVKDPRIGWRWYKCNYSIAFTESLSPRYSIIFCEDITDQREKELASLRFSNYKEASKFILNLEYNLTLDSFEARDGILPDKYVSDFTGSYTSAFERILSAVLPEYKEDFQDRFSREHLFKALQKGANHETKEYLVNYEGKPTWIRIFYQILKDPYTSFINVWMLFSDIHEEKQSELRLLEMAKIDQVTGIYNRAAFTDYVTEKCLVSVDGLPRALIMLDVDGFGKVNDVFGHTYGDTVLKDIAQTLKLVISNEDIVARIGGDEFAIYATEFSDIAVAKERLRIIIAAVYRELKLGIKISISAGVAIFPRDGNNFDTLYEKADIALYHAKLTGRNKYVIYEDAMQDIEVMVTAIDEVASPNLGIYIRTFGYFDVFVNGEALLIQNAKAKELLALLVDRRGGYLSPGDIIASLWEDEPVNKVTLGRLRKVVMILRNVLKAHGIEELIDSKKGLRRLNASIANCDLYNYLSGKPEYTHLFKGSYMLNYSWGELMIQDLENKRFFTEFRGMT